MDCLNCANIALPGKAMCQACIDAAQQRRSNAISAWEGKVTDSFINSNTDLPAPYILRLLAAILDMSLIGTITFIVQSIVLSLVFEKQVIVAVSNQQSGHPSLYLMNEIFAISTISAVVSFLIGGLIYIGFENSNWKATPGKKLLGLQVIDQRSNMHLIATIKRYFLRSSGVIIPLCLGPIVKSGCFGITILIIPFTVLMAALGLLLFLDPIAIFFNSQRLALHDMFAGTLVVKTKEASFLKIILTIFLIILVAAVYITSITLYFRYLNSY